MSIFQHDMALEEFNLWMNGPRVHWGRGLQLVFQLFITFNRGEIFEGETEGDTSFMGLLGAIFSYVIASTMAVEQVYLLRLNNGTEYCTDASKFASAHIMTRFCLQGKSKSFLSN